MASLNRVQLSISSTLAQTNGATLQCCTLSSTRISRLTARSRLNSASRSFSSTRLSIPNPRLNPPRPSPCSTNLRHFQTMAPRSAVSAPRRTKDLRNSDRGPKSKEDTQTDFSVLNVLGGTANPSTSVDICTFDGFVLDSGLRVAEGDGVLLTASEAFVWRPWMGGAEELKGAESVAGVKRRGDGIVSGNSFRTGASETERTGGIINSQGQFEIPQQAWGLFALLWPKPDLLIIGTGPSIRPLAPSTRTYLQDLGVRIEVLDTRNAASQFNLLATERGVQEVAAALVPLGFGVARNRAAVEKAFGNKSRRQ